MTITYDLPDEFKALYGVRASGFNLDKVNDRTAMGSRLYKQGPSGWYFMPVKLATELELWNPIMRITARKTVIETPMVEMPGSVKEIISNDDYVINIKGIIKRPNGTWPDTELEQLKRLWDLRAAIEIESALTGIFLKGNEYVVLTNMSIPDKPGSTEAVLYELEMVSDTIFPLEITE